jgi:hypothetical protein
MGARRRNSDPALHGNHPEIRRFYPVLGAAAPPLTCRSSRGVAGLRRALASRWATPKRRRQSPDFFTGRSEGQKGSGAPLWTGHCVELYGDLKCDAIADKRGRQNLSPSYPSDLPVKKSGDSSDRLVDVDRLEGRLVTRVVEAAWGRCRRRRRSRVALSYRQVRRARQARPRSRRPKAFAERRGRGR